MNIYLFSLIAVIVFYSLMQYRQHSIEQSLQKRWKLINCVNDVVKNENYSIELKRSISLMIAQSMDENLLPKLIFFGTAKLIFESKEYRKSKKDFFSLMSSDEREEYIKAFRISVEINALRAFHWYAFFGLFFGLFVIVSIIFLKINDAFGHYFETLSFNNYQINLAKITF